MNWYNKFDKKEQTGSLNCPNCDQKYLLEMFYAIEPRACVTCGHELMIISLYGTHKFVYTIDLAKAPSVFRAIIDHLSKKDNKEGYNELKELVLLFSEHHDEGQQGQAEAKRKS
jgi:Zn ribbon nucleic-acid-binding protein